MKTTLQPILSIDIGGTKLLAALVSPVGKVLTRHVEPTAALDQYESVVRQIDAAAHRLQCSGTDGLPRPSAVSIAVAGAIDVEQGMVTTSPNLPQWKNVPLRDRVREKLQIETF
ncbi:MAG: ROK family protein, partial [Dehalococcoidia bacterium]|nr:ROK family protein [Dehalococcoidia bacterium]